MVHRPYQALTGTGQFAAVSPELPPGCHGLLGGRISNGVEAAKNDPPRTPDRQNTIPMEMAAHATATRLTASAPPHIDTALDHRPAPLQPVEDGAEVILPFPDLQAQFTFPLSCVHSASSLRL